MLLGIACVLAAGLCWAAIGVFFSRLAARGTGFAAQMFTCQLAMATAGWLVLPDWPTVLAGQAERTGQLAAMLLTGGLAVSIGIMAMQVAMRTGHHAASWTMSQSAMVVPFLASVLVLGDPFVPVKALGVGLVLGEVACFGLARKEPRGPARSGRPVRLPVPWIVIALLSLAMLGVQQTMVLVPSYWPGWSDTGRLRVPLLLTGPLGGYAVLLAVRRVRPRRGNLLPALLYASIGLPSQVFFFTGLDRLSRFDLAGLAFPLAIGACILSFALYSMTILREHISLLHAGGIALGLAGMSLIVLG